MSSATSLFAICLLGNDYSISNYSEEYWEVLVRLVRYYFGSIPAKKLASFNRFVSYLENREIFLFSLPYLPPHLFRFFS